MVTSPGYEPSDEPPAISAVERRGQAESARSDPFFTAPVAFGLGLLLVCGGGAALAFSSATWHFVLAAIPVILGVVLMVSAHPRVRFYLRAGTFGRQPSTKSAILGALTGPNPPAAAGEGWSWYIAHEPASEELILLRGNWAGLVRQVNAKVLRVKAGTRLGELTRMFSDVGLAYFDRPQFDQLSLGGCVRTAGHGWARDAWLIDSVVAVEAAERGSGRVVERQRSDPDFLSVLLDPKYVLLELEMAGQTNTLITIETKRFPLPNAGEGAAADQPDLSAWLAAPFRLWFVYPDRIVTAVGTATSDAGAAEADVSGCCVRTRYYSRILGFARDTLVVDSVADAHTLIETVWPFETFVARVARTRNVELYAEGDIDVQGSVLPLAEFHGRHGGRTEYRARSAGGRILWALDVTCRPGEPDERGVPANIAEWLRLMHRFGARRAASHTGKVIPTTLHPIKDATMEEIWRDNSFGAAVVADLSA